jgi:shikimate kinase
MKKRFRPIVIAGFMGAGKTAVASALARRLDCSMIDLDDFISEREGRTPQMIIEEEGEARFREIESAALRAALQMPEVRVIALGGGAWTIPANRALINEYTNRTVWLDAPFELCWGRIETGIEARPLARERKIARELYDGRRSLYRQAGLRLEVDESISARAIAKAIIVALDLRTGESND